MSNLKLIIFFKLIIYEYFKQFNLCNLNGYMYILFLWYLSTHWVIEKNKMKISIFFFFNGFDTFENCLLHKLGSNSIKKS